MCPLLHTILNYDPEASKAMLLSTYAICLFVVLSWFGTVRGFNHIFPGSIKRSIAPKPRCNGVRFANKPSSSRVFALNPGVPERIEDIRVQHAALDARVKQEKNNNVLHDGDILSALETLGIIVESADALAQINENLQVLKEDMESPKPKNPELFSKLHTSFMECKRDFEKNLNLAVANLEYDPSSFEPDIEETPSEEADKD